MEEEEEEEPCGSGYMNYSPKSCKGGYIGDYKGDYYKGLLRGFSEFRQWLI